MAPKPTPVPTKSVFRTDLSTTKTFLEFTFKDSCLVSDLNSVSCIQKHPLTPMASSEVQVMKSSTCDVKNSVIPKAHVVIKEQGNWGNAKLINMGNYEVTTDISFYTSKKNNAMTLEFGVTIPIGNLLSVITATDRAILVMKGTVRFAGFKDDNFAATLRGAVWDIGDCMTTRLVRQYYGGNIVGNEGLTLFDCIFTGISKQKLHPNDTLVKVTLTYDWLGTNPPFQGKSLTYWFGTVIHWIIDSLVYRPISNSEESDDEWQIVSEESFSSV